MNVDPAILRAFAGVLEQSAGALSGVNALEPFRNSEGVMRGTEFDESNALAAAATADAIHALAGRMSSVADIAAGVARDYEVAEHEFVAKLSMMDGPK